MPTDQNWVALNAFDRRTDMREPNRPEEVTQEFVVCVAMDAFRLAMGLPLRNFSADYVIRWLTAASRISLARAQA